MKSGQLISRLKDKGYRLTPQRAMILSAIESTDSHISAEEIYVQVAAAFPQVNISTVYRTLELLRRLGLVYEIDVGEGRIRYHPESKGHHHHLVCQKCGSIIDLDEATLYSLKDALLQRYNFSAELRHMAISGLCEDCRKQR